MSDDLYFIPIIAKALQQKDTEQALLQAFEQIKSLGRKPQYQQGLAQFEQFMASANSHAKKNESDLLETSVVGELITELATDTFEGSAEEKQLALDIIQSRSEWKEEYDRFIADIEEFHRASTGIVISVARENRALGSVKFTQNCGPKTMDNIVSGSYTMSLATGRVIWQGELTERDVIWTEAFPSQALELAADTGEPKGEPTQEISIFDGEIILRVFPGLESGRIEITMNLSGSS